jgi:hypothetical protein
LGVRNSVRALDEAEVRPTLLGHSRDHVIGRIVEREGMGSSAVSELIVMAPEYPLNPA